MGVLEYFDRLPGSGREFSLAPMFGIGLGMVLQVDCGILLVGPALRWMTGLLRRTWVANIVPFDSWIGFHIVLATTVCVVVVGHVTSMIVSFCK